jgi:hypothetical protein
MWLVEGTLFVIALDGFFSRARHSLALKRARCGVFFAYIRWLIKAFLRRALRRARDWDLHDGALPLNKVLRIIILVGNQNV